MGRVARLIRLMGRFNALRIEVKTVARAGIGTSHTFHVRGLRLRRTRLFAHPIRMIHAQIKKASTGKKGAGCCICSID